MNFPKRIWRNNVKRVLKESLTSILINGLKIYSLPRSKLKKKVGITILLLKNCRPGKTQGHNFYQRKRSSVNALTSVPETCIRRIARRRILFFTGNDHAWEIVSRSVNREERDQGYVVYTRKRTREIYSFIGILIGYSFWSIFFFPTNDDFLFNHRRMILTYYYFIKIRTKGRRLIVFF